MPVSVEVSRDPSRATTRLEVRAAVELPDHALADISGPRYGEEMHKVASRALENELDEAFCRHFLSDVVPPRGGKVRFDEFSSEWSMRDEYRHFDAAQAASKFSTLAEAGKTAHESLKAYSTAADAKPTELDRLDAAIDRVRESV